MKRNQLSASRAGYQEGIVSAVANTALAALKFWAGTACGSVAIVADAWHTLSDTFSSVIVIISVRLSSMRPDAKHPFGYGRWEQIAALFIGCLLGIVAYDFATEAIERLTTRTTTNFGTLAIVVTIVSIVSKEALAQYAFYLARRSGNDAVKADGWHHRSDALSSVVVLVGIAFASKVWWIDAALGLVVAAMLFYATYQIIRQTVDKLLGENPSPELIEEVRQIAADTCHDELQVHHLHLHNYVTHKELTLHIKMDGTKSLEECHAVATLLEENIKAKLGVETTIHLEPLGQEHDSD